MQNKSAVVFFSLSGNTRKVAEKIAHAIGADAIEIKTATPITGTYDEIVERAKGDVAAKHTPEIAPIDISNYDHIIVGTPTWWYTMAPAVRTFLSSTDFASRRVDVYITHAGWAGTGVRDMQAIAKSGGATVGTSIEIEFDGHDMQTDGASVEKWINELK